jgi:hypothetical protein
MHSTWVAVKVKQQHMCHKADDEPEGCFQDSLKSGRHQQRIRPTVFLCHQSRLWPAPLPLGFIPN